MPKAKHNKDPARPKRAMTGFMYYSKERRQQIVDENPDLNFADVAKRLGVEWNNLSPLEKSPYEQAAAEDKVRYDSQMKHYVPNPKYAKKGKRKDPNKPKRAMSAYLYFCKAVRDSVKAEFPEKSMTEIQKVLGLRWQETTDAERMPYIKQANADRERYDSEVMKMYNKNQEDDDDDDEDDDDDDEDVDDDDDEDDSNVLVEHVDHVQNQQQQQQQPIMDAIQNIDLLPLHHDGSQQQYLQQPIQMQHHHHYHQQDQQQHQHQQQQQQQHEDPRFFQSWG